MDSPEKSLRLPPGTPLLIVGFTPNRPFDRYAFCDGMPEIVLAGHLDEPHYPGQALLLGPGPMAGSIAPRGFSHQAFCAAADQRAFSAFIALRHRHLDERGAYQYFVYEDEYDTAALLRDARGTGTLAWPDHLRFAQVIVQRVALAYRSLDPFDQAAIRP